MDNKLVKWNTGRIIRKHLDDLRFFTNYEVVNKELYDIYNHLYVYTYANYNGNASINYGSDLYDSLVKHLDNMIEFQKMVDAEDDTIDLAKEAKDRFDNEHVRHTLAIDRQQIARLELLLEYAKSIRILFNNLVSLTEGGRTPSMELTTEIQEVLMNKGLDHFTIPKELLINNQITNQDV